jgi:CheY-like chemotaxis protein
MDHVHAGGFRPGKWLDGMFARLANFFTGAFDAQSGRAAARPTSTPALDERGPDSRVPIFEGDPVHLDEPGRKTPRVLIAEDDPVQQVVTWALLSDFGVTPLLAADGAEAVALACGIEFDIILMDLQMPVLDGLTATAQIRRFELERSRPRVPVVAYTSCGFTGSEPFLRAAGIDAVLEKPCDPNALRDCLLRCCPTLSLGTSGPGQLQRISIPVGGGVPGRSGSTPSL